MAVLRSNINTNDPASIENREKLLLLVEELKSNLEKGRFQGKDSYQTTTLQAKFVNLDTLSLEQ